MGEYSAAQDETSIHGKQLSPGVVDVVRFAGRRRSAEVMNRSEAGDLFFTIDGSVPEVEGRHAFLVGPRGNLEVDDEMPTNETVVHLVSADAVLYSVTAAPFR